MVGGENGDVVAQVLHRASELHHQILRTPDAEVQVHQENALGMTADRVPSPSATAIGGATGVATRHCSQAPAEQRQREQRENEGRPANAARRKDTKAPHGISSAALLCIFITKTRPKKKVQVYILAMPAFARFVLSANNQSR